MLNWPFVINVALGVLSLAFLVVALILVLTRAGGRARSFGAVGFAIVAVSGIGSTLSGYLLPSLTEMFQLPYSIVLGVDQLLLAVLTTGGLVFLALAVHAATAAPAPGVATWRR